MDIHTLTQFFMWSSIINGAFLLYISLVVILFPGFVYRMHTRFFRFSREAFDIIIYSFLGLYKIFFFGFSLVPYLALRIMG